MKLDEFKQLVEAQRLSSLALALDALRKSSEMQALSVLTGTISKTNESETK